MPLFNSFILIILKGYNIGIDDNFYHKYLLFEMRKSPISQGSCENKVHAFVPCLAVSISLLP
jgi:hypothetical protein